ncbi:hypothetical protein [Streptomyces hydrogenans]|uniref:hypothetical protein n=1 Tax=Streptomyces hydrogenans TaxID=1873719 RepID=UPI0035DC4A0A
MIKNALRGSAALLLALPPLALSTTAGATAPTSSAAVLPLAEAVGQIPIADESRAGYSRDSFKHWNLGLDAGDGCNTRAEVLLAEAVEAPTVAAGCKLSGGRWL